MPNEPLDAAFSMYGVVSPQLDTQSVRIYPIERFLSLQSADEIDDIRVTSTNLLSGERLVWEDTVVAESDGHHEFIFWAAFRAEYGVSYRIEAERISDGDVSFAEIRVPEPVGFEVVNPRPQGLEVAVLGEGIRVLTPQVRYVIQAPSGPPRGYQISYTGKEEPLEDGWLVEIRMSLERETVQGWYNVDTGYTLSHCGTVYLRALVLDVLVGNSPWDPPGGVFDSNVLVQQRTMSNVVNGFGFIGAGYRDSEALPLSRDVVEGACFLYSEDP